MTELYLSMWKASEALLTTACVAEAHATENAEHPALGTPTVETFLRQCLPCLYHVLVALPRRHPSSLQAPFPQSLENTVLILFDFTLTL